MPDFDLVKDGARQMTICNACRYCEGYCAVFPAMEQRRIFTKADLTYLANLCFDCRDCYYACQYAPPHEFGVNIPKLMSGLRADTWLAGSAAEFALSPSGQLRFALTRELELHAAIALAHQARGSPVPLPSLGDLPLDAGLESALQAELGASLRPGADLQLEAAYFYHRYRDVVYLELILDCAGNTDPEAAQNILREGVPGSICRAQGLPTADGLTHGLELYVKRELGARVVGFVSYTLAFARATARDGTHFTPQSDVRHVANAVLRFDLGAGFTLGLRLHLRSGKTSVNTLFDTASARFERVEARLPGFFRADVRASYSWKVPFGRMELSAGVQNLTASSEPTNRDCVFDPTGDWSSSRVPIVCTIDYQRAILLPNLGIRAEM